MDARSKPTTTTPSSSAELQASTALPLRVVPGMDDRTLDVLRGMRPGLVRDLALLSGSTLDGLDVTLALAPFGDRMVLSAYGLMVAGRAKPQVLDVIAAASSVCAEAVSAEAIAQYLAGVEGD